MSDKELQGFMYVAKRQCGRISAMSWDDAGAKREIAKSVAQWVRRGDIVERVARYKGDPIPDFICDKKDDCACRKAKETP